MMLSSAGDDDAHAHTNTHNAHMLVLLATNEKQNKTKPNQSATLDVQQSSVTPSNHWLLRIDSQLYLIIRMNWVFGSFSPVNLQLSVKLHNELDKIERMSQPIFDDTVLNLNFIQSQPIINHHWNAIQVNRWCPSILFIYSFITIRFAWNSIEIITFLLRIDHTQTDIVAYISIDMELHKCVSKKSYVSTNGITNESQQSCKWMPIQMERTRESAQYYDPQTQHITNTLVQW